jgi:hypothetical protein
VPADLPVGGGVVQADAILDQQERAEDRSQIGQQHGERAAREARFVSAGEHVFAP